MSYGMDAKVGMSFQNSMGTLNVGSMHWLTPISETVALKKAQLIQKGLRGGIYAEGSRVEGPNTVGGDLNIEVDGVNIGLMLETVMARTSVNSGAFSTHTFKPRNADFDALSAERPFTYHKHLGDAGSAQLYYNMNGDTLDLAISNGQLLTAKLGLLGGKYSQAAASAAVYRNAAPLDWSVSSVSLGAVARVNFESLSFAYKGNLAAKNTLGDGTAANKYPARNKRTGHQTLEVSGTVLFDNQTDLQNFVSQARQQLIVSFKGASNISSGYDESVKIDIPSLLITDFPQGIPGAGELAISFKGSAEYNVGSGTLCAITVVNSIAGY